MGRVSHQLTIGSTVYSSSVHSRLVMLDLQASLATPVNSCRITLGPPIDLNISLDEPVTVELGYEDDLLLSFTGIVDAVERSIDSVAIDVMGSSRELLAAHFNLFYEESKAGDIVSDIASRLAISTGNVESGNNFPAYAIGDNQTAYDHLKYLARLNGFDLYTDTDDKLVFAQYNPQEIHSFEYGVNIISLTLNEPVAAITGVEVYGESPSGHGGGADAYSWLTKQQVIGSAGDTTGMPWQLREPAFKDLDSSGAAATALFDDRKKYKCGWLKTLGYPQARLGDGLQVANMPDGDLNDTYRIAGLRHSLNKHSGFITTLQWAEA